MNKMNNFISIAELDGKNATMILKIPYRDKDEKERIERALDRLGDEGYELLFQARGWAVKWLEGKDDDEITTKAFIEKVDRVLGLRNLERKTEMEKLCPKCKINEATEPHPCPYQSDVNDNDDFKCICCKDCEKDCAEDI